MRPYLLRFRWFTLAVIGILLFVLSNWGASSSDRDGSRLSAEADKVISKQAVIEAAESWVKQQKGMTGSLSHNPVSFQSDPLVSGYLLKNKLVTDYAHRYIQTYPVEYWQVELKNSFGTAYLLDLDMVQGNVLGWRVNHKEPAPSKEEGQRIAETYLANTQKLGKPYSVVGPDSKHPNRFKFSYPEEKIGEAHLVVEVEVRGTEVTAYHAAFQVPSSYAAWLDEQDSASGNMSRWSLILTGIMALAAIFYAIRYRKKTAFGQGLLLVFAFVALYLFNNWNQLPALQAMGYSESEDPFMGHATAILLIIVSSLFALALGIATYLSLAAGGTLWRIQGTSKWPKWSDSSFGRETLQAMGRGYGLGIFMLGLQGVMLWIAQAGFGMWSVNDPSSSYYNFLHVGWFPLMAWTAAISEEAIYRLFGIAFFQRLIRSTFIAVLAPSLIWAFGHTQYPIYPVYTRLIEVTLLGLLFGYALLKYGFLTALFTHAIIDSTLMGLPLIGWENAGYSIAGVFYIAFPALAAIVIWLLHGRLFKRSGRAPGLTLRPEEPS